MGLRARILRVTAGPCGPASENGLRGLARGKDNFDVTFKTMKEQGHLVMYGDRKGAKYGPPGLKRGRRG